MTFKKVNLEHFCHKLTKDGSACEEIIKDFESKVLHIKGIKFIKHLNINIGNNTRTFLRRGGIENLLGTLGK